MTSTQTETLTITDTDAVYVSQQIMKDLCEIRKSYSKLVKEEDVYKTTQAIMTFLVENAVDKIGFVIYDPLDNNLAYQEWIYIVLRGDALPQDIRGTKQGKGGKPVTCVSNLPSSAKFDVWVSWSGKFLELSTEEQKSVIQDTGWDLPGTNNFKFRYQDSTGWIEDGYFVSRDLGVQVRTYNIGI